MRWIAFALTLLAACGSRKEKPPETGATTASLPSTPLAAGADAGAAEATNPLGLDPKVVAELRALGKREWERLSAAAPRQVEFPPQPEDPSGCCGAERSSPDIAALGACTRPVTDEGKQALLTKVDAFIDKKLPRSRADAANPTRIRAGCEDQGSVVVDAQTLRTEGKELVQRWWTLRVTNTSVTSIAESTDCHGDCAWNDAEWSQQTLLLADLDGDGVRDPIIRRNGKGFTELDPVFDMLLGTTAPAKLANQLDGGASIADWQPADADRTVVIRYQPPNGPDEKLACLTATGQQATCPALERELRRQQQETAAGELAENLTGYLFDRDGLADRLAILEVPAAERERYLAAAVPPPLSALLGRYVAQRDAAMAARGEGKEARYRPAAAASRATEVRAATGQLACPAPTASQTKAALTQLNRALTRADRTATGAKVLAGCVAPTASQWMLEWSTVIDSEDHTNRGLFHLQGTTATPLVQGHTRLMQTHDGPALDDPDQLPAAELWQSSTSMGALVRGPAKLTAVVDGKVTGTRDGAADLAWNTGTPDGQIELADDGVARTMDAGVTTYWSATPTGITSLGAHGALDLSTPLAATAAAGQLLETLDRTDLADALIRSSFTDAELSSAVVRDDLHAALTLLGAPAATIAQVKSAR